MNFFYCKFNWEKFELKLNKKNLEVNLYHGPDNRIASDYRVNVISGENDMKFYKNGIFSLGWVNVNDYTHFIFEVELSRFTNSWAGFSFSEDQVLLVSVSEFK